MDSQFLLDRIAATKSAIVAYEAAIMALTTDGISQYSLDTGQTRQTVTRFDLDTLTKQVDLLYNRLSSLQARLYGAGVIMRPGW